LARKILLADDSVTAQNMGRKILTDAGYEVITVNNGSAALKRIAEQEPDLIVLDVYMPGYSGLEVCQRIKENHQTARIPILLTVGKLEPFKPEEARKARADAYIIKPFEASELLVALTKLEDKIVPKPEPYKPGRFAKAIAAVEQVNQSDSGEGFGDSELGWKDRLRFPSKKAKAPEPDPEPEVQFKRSRGFRDLPAESTPQPTGPDQSFERPIPAGLPKDITAEEIAAISAAAAKLQGREESPAADSQTASPEAKSQPAETQEQSAHPAEAAASEESPAPLPSVSAATDSPAASNAPAETSAAEELPSATFAGVPEPSSESHLPDTSPTETIAAVSATSAEAAESARADSSDEDSRRDQNEEKIAARSEVTAETQIEPVAGDHTGTEPAAPESVATQAASPEAVSTSEAETAARSAAAGDAEVMAALQNLSPANGQGWRAESASDGSIHHSTANPYANLVEPSPATVAASASSAQSAELDQNLSGPRWIAEPMPLGSDEATIILEKEMEKAYAAFAAAEAVPGVFGRDATTDVSGESVNSSLASLAASEPAGRDENPVSSARDVNASEAASVLAPDAPSRAEDSGKASPLPESAAEPAASAPEEVAAVAPQDTSAAPKAESAAVAAAASGSTVGGWTALQPSQPASDVVSAPPAEARSRGEDEIERKDAELAAASAAAWANWRQIRDTIIDSTVEVADAAAAAASDLGEDEPGRRVAESPVSAASAPDTPASDTPVSETPAAAPDAIASIVDSVLAELKPKLVEEIARKMKNEKKKKKE
jgi:CheY-like chemotaxis protein